MANDNSRPKLKSALIGLSSWPIFFFIEASLSKRFFGFSFVHGVGGMRAVPDGYIPPEPDPVIVHWIIILFLSLIAAIALGTYFFSRSSRRTGSETAGG